MPCRPYDSYVFFGSVFLALFLFIPTSLAREGDVLKSDLHRSDLHRTEFCQALTKHRPLPNVKYQAGVDSQGKQVAPADRREKMKLQDPVIELQTDLSTILTKMDATKTPFKEVGGSEVKLGTLTLQHGKVFYNGKPLSGAEQERLAVLCLKPKK
jgi:hypothetical protein